jgi:hypothetical protein
VENAEDEREGEEEEQWPAEAGGESELLSTVHYSLFTVLFLLFFLWPLFIIQFATQHKRQLEVASGYLAV